MTVEPTSQPGHGEHFEHDALLARLEDDIAAGRTPDANLRGELARCPRCDAEGWRMIDAARRLRFAASVIEFEAEPAPSVRDRVSAAVLGADAATVHPVEPTRMGDAPVVVRRPGRASNVLFGRFAWAGAGAAAAAIVIAFALNGGSSGPSVAAAFTMAGTELAPGASGTARLSPVDGGSVAMTLVMRGLPPSRPGEFYELWWVGPDKRHISCGTFRADGSVVDLRFTAGVDIGTTVLMEVTIEKDDGDPAPGPHVAQ